MKKILLFFLLIAPLQGNSRTEKRGFGPGAQDWGWYEVRKGAHMFYWLFYTQDPFAKSYYDKPLVIYLHGGPGISTTGFANFVEVGPLFINGVPRPTSWVNHVNLLLIDNPVGTGYSYIEPGENFTSTDKDIGAEMVEFLIKFYRGHSEFNSVPSYVFGESYGGKMVVEIAKQLHAGIKAQKLKANFKGIGLGDPWISPMDHLRDCLSVLLHTGIVDQQGHDRIKNTAAKLITEAVSGQKLISTVFKELFRLLYKETGGVNIYNYLERTSNSEKDLNAISSALVKPKEECNATNEVFSEINELMNGKVKKYLKIARERHFENSNACVFATLMNELKIPVTNVVEEILNSTDLQVVVYNGQLDLVVSSLSTLRWVDRLKWPGSTRWQSASREPLVIDGIVEGYVKSAGNLQFYWINRAGHMVPAYNPKAALELLRRVTKLDKPGKS